MLSSVGLAVAFIITGLCSVIVSIRNEKTKDDTELAFVFDVLGKWCLALSMLYVFQMITGLVLGV